MRVQELISMVSACSPVKVRKGRKRELETIFYFLPDNYDGIEHSLVSSSVIESSDGVDSLVAYFDWVEKGVFPVAVTNIKHWRLLYQAQRWRGIHMTMYMEGVLDGSMPYSVILEGVSDSVAKYLAGNLFGGIDKELIMSVYRDVSVYG